MCVGGGYVRVPSLFLLERIMPSASKQPVRFNSAASLRYCVVSTMIWYPGAEHWVLVLGMFGVLVPAGCGSGLLCPGGGQSVADLLRQQNFISNRRSHKPIRNITISLSVLSVAPYNCIVRWKHQLWNPNQLAKFDTTYPIWILVLLLNNCCFTQKNTKPV